MSCLRDLHPIRDTQGEIAYHASILVAFFVETIKIVCRVAAQAARRTHTASAVSSRAGGSHAGNRSTDEIRVQGRQGRPMRLARCPAGWRPPDDAAILAAGTRVQLRQGDDTWVTTRNWISCKAPTR